MNSRIMASVLQNFISLAAVIIFVALFSASVVRSDPFNCKEVQCPPEIKCPDDSILRVTYETTKYDENSKNTIDVDEISDEDEISNQNERTNLNQKIDHNPRHVSKFVVEKSENKNHPHDLQKRSLQYKRRESIKIVPGDYISLVPDSVRYHHQMNQNHHKWKRSVVDDVGDYDTLTTVSTFEECCPKMTCICSGNCPFPNCIKTSQAPYQREPGSDIPGKCCPKLQCIDEPNCANVNGTIYFWNSKCKKCTCVSGHKMCQKECEDDSGCFSENLRKFFLNGISWQEDPCTQCQCNNGEAKCQTSFCKPMNCANKIKIDGECCLVCAAENSTKVEITTTTEFSVLLANESSEAISLRTTYTPATSKSSSSTTTSSSSATTVLLNLSTTITPSSTTTTTTSSSPIKTSTATISPTTKSHKSSTTAASEIGIESTTLPSTVFQISSTPEIILSNVAVKSESPPIKITTTIVNTSTLATSKSISEAAVPVSTISTSTEHSLYFNTDTESIILYTVIVVLLVICCMFAGLYIHEVTKRQTYSSIPNSDSNLSQMPRPKTEESA